MGGGGKPLAGKWAPWADAGIDHGSGRSLPPGGAGRRQEARAGDAEEVFDNPLGQVFGEKSVGSTGEDPAGTWNAVPNEANCPNAFLATGEGAVPQKTVRPGEKFTRSETNPRDTGRGGQPALGWGGR